MNQQSKKNLTNRIVALAGITVFAFFIGIYVCVFSNYLKKYNTRKKLFGATYMTMNNEFYKIVNNQIRMQVEKNGNQMIPSPSPSPSWTASPARLWTPRP